MGAWFEQIWCWYLGGRWSAASRCKGLGDGDECCEPLASLDQEERVRLGLRGGFMSSIWGSLEQVHRYIRHREVQRKTLVSRR